MAKYDKLKQDNPLVKVTRSPAFDDARWPTHATRPPPEVAAKVRSLLTGARIFGDIDKPNLAYMNALLNAVEGGYAAKWRRHPVSREEIIAAYYATGRKPKPERQPGDDEAEDAFR